MNAQESKNASGLHSTSPHIVATNQSTRRRILYMERKKSVPEQGLEESLACALQASDSELGQILHEVDEISTILKSPNPDPETLRVAGHPAVWSAVRQSLLDRELRYLALTDDLTCLFNRRGFFAAATQQLKRSRRSSECLLLLFCDVDNLKKINDTHGHQEGDLALIRTADALERTFRSSDILARLGGDEFVVLALAAPQDSEQWILNRLERNLKKAAGSGNGYTLSLSVGVARFDAKNAITLGELMVQADRAMYEKKRTRKLPGKVGT
jgi:diguanylate cyclase (GGDEF)-like protein